MPDCTYTPYMRYFLKSLRIAKRFRTAKRFMLLYFLIQYIMKAGSVIVIIFMTVCCIYSFQFYNYQFNPLARRGVGELQGTGRERRRKRISHFSPQLSKVPCVTFILTSRDTFHHVLCSFLQAFILFQALDAGMQTKNSH